MVDCETTAPVNTLVISMATGADWPALNERMNKWISLLHSKIPINQAEMPRHDNCVHLLVSW